MMNSFSCDEHLDAAHAADPDHAAPVRRNYPAPVFPKGCATQLLDLLAERNTKLVRSHPFVLRCANGNASLHALKIFLAQHGQYGARFTRYLCALIANLDPPGDAMRLAHNLAEELGFGDGSQEPHASIYRRMLADCGIEQARTAILPATQRLIDTMFDYCKRDNPVYGLAALYLGAESIVPGLYTDLLQGFLARGVPEEQLEFFRIHIECDDGHGMVMRDILARLLEDNPAQMDAVYEVSSKLITARLNFFTNIEWEAT